MIYGAICSGVVDFQKVGAIAAEQTKFLISPPCFNKTSHLDIQYLLAEVRVSWEKDYALK